MSHRDSGRPQKVRVRRVKIKQTGEVGTVTKVIGNCLFVAMDGGWNSSGAKQFYVPIKESR